MRQHVFSLQAQNPRSNLHLERQHGLLELVGSMLGLGKSQSATATAKAFLTRNDWSHRSWLCSSCLLSFSLPLSFFRQRNVHHHCHSLDCGLSTATAWTVDYKLPQLGLWTADLGCLSHYFQALAKDWELWTWAWIIIASWFNSDSNPCQLKPSNIVFDGAPDGQEAPESPQDARQPNTWEKTSLNLFPSLDTVNLRLWPWRRGGPQQTEEQNRLRYCLGDKLKNTKK